MSEGEQSRPSGVEVTLNRDLGLAEVLMIGLGPNIGSSIFLLIGLARAVNIVTMKFRRKVTRRAGEAICGSRRASSSPWGSWEVGCHGSAIA